MQLRVSLSNLHKELDHYSSLLGYRMNTSKTEALSLNIPYQMLSHLSQSFNYSWRTSTLRYLGVNLTSSYDTLYKAKLPSIIYFY